MSCLDMPSSTTDVFNHLRRTLRSGYHTAADMDVIDLVPRLTLLTLLLSPMDDPGIRPFGLLLAGVGVLFAPAARHPGFWLLLTFLTGGRLIADWPLADNHAYLLCYRCLAVCISLRMREVRAALALNGRLLIGLAFACATLWKAALSPDYLDGTFFRVVLQVDERFAHASMLFGGLSPEQLATNRRVLGTSGYDAVSPEGGLDAGCRSPEEFFLHLANTDERALVEPGRFTAFAWVLTWWTVSAEAAVALCFLWPLTSRLARHRHLVLLLFCATTYAVAQVVAVCAVLFVCFVAGLAIRTQAGARVNARLERVILQRVPGFTFVKTIARGLAGLESGSELAVALARIEDAWVLSFVVERHASGLFTVFVPSAPTPAAGSIYYLTADRLKLLDVPVSMAVGCIMRLGVGSHELLDSRPQLGAELVQYNAHQDEQSL